MLTVTKYNLEEKLGWYIDKSVYVYYVDANDEHSWKDCLNFGKLIYFYIKEDSLSLDLLIDETTIKKLSYNIPFSTYKLGYDTKPLSGINRESQLCIETKSYDILNGFKYFEVGLFANQLIGQRILLLVMNYLKELFEVLEIKKDELFPRIPLTSKQIDKIVDLNKELYPVKLSHSHGSLSGEDIINLIYYAFTNYPIYFSKNEETGYIDHVFTL